MQDKHALLEKLQIKSKDESENFYWTVNSVINQFSKNGNTHLTIFLPSNDKFECYDNYDYKITNMAINLSDDKFVKSIKNKFRVDGREVTIWKAIRKIDPYGNTYYNGYLLLLKFDKDYSKCLCVLI
jgi:hypothetical protein